MNTTRAEKLRDYPNHIRDYDHVVIGMRIAYLDDRGFLEIPTGIDGEEEITTFASRLSRLFNQLTEQGEDLNWDDFIEEKIIERYGRK